MNPAPTFKPHPTPTSTPAPTTRFSSLLKQITSVCPHQQIEEGQLLQMWESLMTSLDPKSASNSPAAVPLAAAPPPPLRAAAAEP